MCGKNINEVAKGVNCSKQTVQKYLKIKTLPPQISNLLDTKGEYKITVKTALELTKVDDTVDKFEVLEKVSNLNNKQQEEVIKAFNKTESNDYNYYSIRNDKAHIEVGKLREKNLNYDVRRR